MKSKRIKISFETSFPNNKITIIPIEKIQETNKRISKAMKKIVREYKRKQALRIKSMRNDKKN